MLVDFEAVTERPKLYIPYYRSPGSKPPEDEKLFSWERAKRGAKIGALIGGGLSLATVALIGLTSSEKAKNLLEDPNSIAVATAIFAGYFGLVGAVIDGFRPTSRMVKREIEELIEMKDGIVKAVKFAVRPVLSEETLQNKPAYILKTSFVGAGFGVALLGGIIFERFLDNAAERIFGNKLHPPSWFVDFGNTILDHPVETIGIGVALGLGASIYTLAFHDSERNNLNLKT